MKITSSFALIAAFIMSFIATPSAQAATGTWTGGAGATWDTTATNWSGVVGTPWDSTNGPSNTATFSTSGATPLLNNGDVYAGVLDIAIPGAVNNVMTLGRTAGTGILHTPSITLDDQSTLQFSASNLLDGNAVVTRTVGGTVHARFDLFGTTQTVRGLSDTSGLLVVQNSEAVLGGGSNSGTGTLTISTQSSDNFSTNGFIRNGTGRLTSSKKGREPRPSRAPTLATSA